MEEGKGGVEDGWRKTRGVVERRRWGMGRTGRGVMRWLECLPDGYEPHLSLSAGEGDDELLVL